MIYEIHDYGFIQASGEDAKTYLQGQVTCNMDDLTPEMSRLGALCTPQGRVVSIFRAFMLNELIYLRVPKDVLDETMERLKSYAIFSKVIFEDVSAIHQMIALKDDTLDEFQNITLPEEVDDCFYDDDITIVKVPGGEVRYEIYMTKEKFDTVYYDIKDEHEHGSPKDWHLLSIKAGVPLIYKSTKDEFTPHDLNLPAIHAIDFDKGCYTGQEIVIRMEHRGHLKKHLHLINITSDKKPEPNEDIFADDKKIGKIIDIENVFENNYKALALLKDDSLKLELKTKSSNQIQVA
jgi:tRNA-modifying protein YgfZ